MSAIYHDDRFTYIRSAAREKPALYEIKDGKPNLISFQLENGVYIAPKIIDAGYLAVGKRKFTFARRIAGELRPERWSKLPQVQDKAPKPEGLLPKNVQSWLLVGLAFLMVAIMWLTGGKKPQPARPASSAAPAPAPLEVNETKIAELQNRIEELQRQQLVAQSALAQQTRLLGGTQERRSSQPTGASPSGEQPMKIPFKPNARDVPTCRCLPRMSRSATARLPQFRRRRPRPGRSPCAPPEAPKRRSY